MKTFLFGSASSSHQVEGANVHNQIFLLEQKGTIPKVGIASDFLNQYSFDISAARSFGMNAMRISIEWSRLQPTADSWNAEAVAYYHAVFKEMRANGITPMVTLFHWTVPAWVHARGFTSTYLLQKFESFVARVVNEYKSEVKFWLVVNEPEVFAFEIHMLGKKLNPLSKAITGLSTYIQLLKMQRHSYAIIKNSDAAAQVGIAKNVAYHEPFRSQHYLDRLLVWAANTFGNELFVRLCLPQLDFIGLNYYFYHSLQWSWRTLFKRKNKQTIKSDMGEKTYPKGLYYLLKQFKKFDKPLYVTENGIANAHDAMRFRFLEEHLSELVRAKNKGIDVRGYFYWSLTDTYEWKDGFDRKFGLVEVNHQTGERRIRPGFEKEKLQALFQKLN